jgi:hypothetical protein
VNFQLVVTAVFAAQSLPETQQATPILPSDIWGFVIVYIVSPLNFITMEESLSLYTSTSFSVDESFIAVLTVQDGVISVSSSFIIF